MGTVANLTQADIGHPSKGNMRAWFGQNDSGIDLCHGNTESIPEVMLTHSQINNKQMVYISCMISLDAAKYILQWRSLLPGATQCPEYVGICLCLLQVQCHYRVTVVNVKQTLDLNIRHVRTFPKVSRRQWYKTRTSRGSLNHLSRSPRATVSVRSCGYL